MSWTRDVVTSLFSSWLITGVFLDAWAHSTRPELETFFTPWHAVLYSGFLATAGWVTGIAWGARRKGSRPTRLPAGYGLAAYGVAVFAIAGLGDMLWHVAFGVERQLAALLSPTHVALFVGMLLIVTAPFRAACARAVDVPPGWRPLLPVALSLALTGILTAFALQPFHPFAHNFVSRRLAALILERSGGAGFVFARNVQVGLAGFMFATVCLFGPVLLLVRRWRPPPGMVASMIALQCLLMQGSGGFRQPALALLGGLGGLAVEGLARHLRPDAGGRARLLLFSAIAPLLFWSIYLAGVAIRDEGLGWPPELWGGALIWTGLTLIAVTLALSGSAAASSR